MSSYSQQNDHYQKMTTVSKLIKWQIPNDLYFTLHFLSSIAHLVLVSHIQADWWPDKRKFCH